MAQRSMTEAATKKLVEQMLASFAAVHNRELLHNLEARELLQATKTEDKIKHLAGLTKNMHQRTEEIEKRLTDNIYPCIKEIQAELSKAKKRKRKKKK